MTNHRLDRIRADVEAGTTHAADVPWLSAALLEALDTIDKLEGENERLRVGLQRGIDFIDARLSALNGGNE